jgi:hypothetical protein
MSTPTFAPLRRISSSRRSEAANHSMMSKGGR